MMHPAGPLLEKREKGRTPALYSLVKVAHPP
jgi:hypothetical protein